MRDAVLAIDENSAIKITESDDGNTYYIAMAPAGTAQSAAKWKVKRVVISGTTITTTWADGNTNYDNVATDLTALEYS